MPRCSSIQLVSRSKLSTFVTAGVTRKSRVQCTFPDWRDAACFLNASRTILQNFKKVETFLALCVMQTSKNRCFSMTLPAFIKSSTVLQDGHNHSRTIVEGRRTLPARFYETSKKSKNIDFSASCKNLVALVTFSRGIDFQI